MVSYSGAFVCSFISPSYSIQAPSLISHIDTMASQSPADHLIHAVSHFEPPAAFGIRSQSAPESTADAQYQALAHLVDTHATADSKFHVVGNGFQLATDLEGPSAIKAFLKNSFVPAYHDNLDSTQAPVSQPPEIIGNPEAPDATFAMVLHSECVAKNERKTTAVFNLIPGYSSHR
ncbi:hypothetical protein F4859DRAFT_506506 [Xylaria cf. heliscus]|nr:hypothetical protein F4859DRAFT_506506 [Xylaria cf. heliscus]